MGQSNAENLLDIDFDGAAPASLQTASAQSAVSALDGLAGLGSPPMRVTSPSVGAGGGVGGGMEDLMGMFGASGGGGAGGMNGMGAGFAAQTAPGGSDLLDGFAALDVGPVHQPPPPGTQLHGARGNNEDMLDLM